MEQQCLYECYAGFRGLSQLNSSSKELFLTHCGVEECKPGHEFPFVRTEYHMHFILSGKGTFQLDGPEKTLEKGDIFIVPKDCRCSYKADSKEPWCYFWIAFDGTKAVHFLEQAGFSPGVMTRKAFAPVQEYYTYVQNILNARRLTRANELHRQENVYAIFALLIRSRHPAGAGSSLPRYSQNQSVNHAIQYMQSHYRESTVSSVADYVGLNRCYLAALFKDEMGMSPQDYLLGIRMQKAVRMLETTAKPVKEVGALVGYEDPFTFSRAFSRFYGRSPRSYRQEVCSKPVQSGPARDG